MTDRKSVGDVSPTSLADALAALPKNRAAAVSVRTLVRENAAAIREQLRVTRIDDVAEALRQIIGAARGIPPEHVKIEARTVERYLAEFLPTRGPRSNKVKSESLSPLNVAAVPATSLAEFDQQPARSREPGAMSAHQTPHDGSPDSVTHRHKANPGPVE